MIEGIRYSKAAKAIFRHNDADLYRRIFVLQEDGRWPQADRLIAELSDKRLLGHLLAQRYLHPTAYRSKSSELKASMDSYAAHPQAKRISALALNRRPANHRRPPPPITPVSAAWAAPPARQAT